MSTPRPRPQVMKLTDKAADASRPSWRTRASARRAAHRREEGRLRRHGIHHGLGGEQKPFDEVVEHGGARVLIDPKAVMYLLGTEMDYKTDKLSAQFVFSNPNQTGSCGCGESVNLAPAGSDRLESLRS